MVVVLELTIMPLLLLCLIYGTAKKATLPGRTLCMSSVMLRSILSPVKFGLVASDEAVVLRIEHRCIGPSSNRADDVLWTTDERNDRRCPTWSRLELLFRAPCV